MLNNIAYGDEWIYDEDAMQLPDSACAYSIQALGEAKMNK